MSTLREVALEQALRLLWAEVVASGNGWARDFGWPAARDAVLAVLPEAVNPPPSPECAVCGLAKQRAIHDPGLFPASHAFRAPPSSEHGGAPKEET